MAEKNRRTEERNHHLVDKVMMLSEQLSGVQNILYQLIRSQQASSSRSSPPLLHTLDINLVVLLPPPPPPQIECHDDDDDGSNLGVEYLRYD